MDTLTSRNPSYCNFSNVIHGLYQSGDLAIVDCAGQELGLIYTLDNEILGGGLKDGSAVLIVRHEHRKKVIVLCQFGIVAIEHWWLQRQE